MSRFICSVLNNPELTDAPSLASFLSPSFDSSLVSNGTPSYDDNAILGYMASVPLPPPILSSPESKQSVERNVGKASFQIRNLFDKTRRTAVGAVARLGGGNGIDVARTDDEEAFADVERYVNALDEQVKVMSKLASKIVKSCAESGRDLDEIGDALYAVGEVHSPSDDNAAQVEQVTEGENSTTSVKPRSEMIKSRSAGSMFAKMGDGISAVSLLWRQLAESDESMFDEPLQELARDVHAAKVRVLSGF